MRAGGYDYMIIRPATPEDNEALRRLELRTPQGASFRLTDDRRDFAARARLYPGAVLLVIADRTDGIVGVLGGAPVKLRVAGCEHTGGMLFDLRADPDRRTGLSRIVYQLWLEMEKHLRSAGIEFVYGLVKEDNPAMSIYKRMGARQVGARTFWTLPVYRRKKTPAGVAVWTEVDPAVEDSDGSEWFEGYDLWSIHDDPEVVGRITRRYVRAKIQYQDASLKIWDATMDYDRVIAAVPLVYDLARPILGAVGQILPLPAIPRIGQRLRTWYIYDVRLPAGSKALRPMLAAANNLALANKIDFLVFTASDGEPELAAGGRGSLATLRYNLMIKDYQPLPPFKPPFYFDVRMT